MPGVRIWYATLTRRRVADSYRSCIRQASGGGPLPEVGLLAFRRSKGGDIAGRNLVLVLTVRLAPNMMTKANPLVGGDHVVSPNHSLRDTPCWLEEV